MSVYIFILYTHCHAYNTYVSSRIYIHTYYYSYVNIYAYHNTYTLLQCITYTTLINICILLYMYELSIAYLYDILLHHYYTCVRLTYIPLIIPVYTSQHTYTCILLYMYIPHNTYLIIPYTYTPLLQRRHHLQSRTLTRLHSTFNIPIKIISSLRTPKIQRA